MPRRERIYPLLREGEPPVVDVHPDGVPRGIRTRQDLLSQESPFDETYGVTGKTDGNRRNLSAGAGRDFNFGSEEITISALLEFDRTTIDSHTLSSDLGSVDIDEDERTLLTFSFGTNLVAVLPRGFSAYFDFEKHFSRKHIDHWMLTIGGRFEF